MVTKITLEQYFRNDPMIKAGTVLYDDENRDYIFMEHGDTGRGVVVNLRENWVVSAYDTKYPCRLSELNEVTSAKFHLSDCEPTERKYLKRGMKIEIKGEVYTLVQDVKNGSQYRLLNDCVNYLYTTFKSDNPNGITYEQIKDKLATYNIRVIVEDD